MELLAKPMCHHPGPGPGAGLAMGMASLPVLSVGREQAHELNRYETTAMGMVPHYPHCFFCPCRSQSLHRVHAMSQPSLSMSIIPERSPIANLLAPWLCQASQM